jgi:MoxR-like ATPase
MVNAALYLRRPLLITGPPGTGKSSLAYAVAEELKLGEVLRWPINSRSTLAEGLYRYDAVARLRDASLSQTLSAKHPADALESDIGQYVALGPTFGDGATSGPKAPRALDR